MKVAIMQPYFYPYIGYFQLINYVDQFVIYDDIEYVKQSWINRNRILVNGQASYISLPLKKDSDYLTVNMRILADSWDKDRTKLLQRLSGSYLKAPNFNAVFECLERAICYDDRNLFSFLLANLNAVLTYLDIKTPVLMSSQLGDFSKLKSQEKVLTICESLSADEYVNPIGGLELYDRNDFHDRGINLSFIKSKEIRYEQFESEFIPFLSIIDVMMFNDPAEVNAMLSEYDCL